MNMLQELQQQSGKVERERKEYWEKFDTEIRPNVIEEIKRLANEPTALYWRSFTYKNQLGKAEKEYLIKMGFKLTTSNNPLESVYHKIISW